MLEAVLFVALGGLIFDYPRKFINMESKKFSDDLIKRSKLYRYLRKFLKESSALFAMKNIIAPLSFVVGLLLMGYGIYAMVVMIKARGF